MKTAVSLPDDLFAEAETYARSKNRSRSQLYAEALREYLNRHSDDLVTAALNAFLETEDVPLDPFVAAAADRILLETEW